MIQMDYEKILSKIESLADEANEESRYDKAANYRTEALRLKEWLDGDKQGECPVDLNKYGIPAEIEIAASSTSVDNEKQSQADLVETKVVEKNEVTAEAYVLSPEQRTIREQLKQVRTQLTDAKWGEAVSLASLIVSHADGDAKIEATQLLDEARQKRDFVLDADLVEGDAALEAGNKEQAQRYYESALTIDPNNDHARAALHRIKSEGEIKGKLSAEKIAELRGGLKDRKNLKRLGESVYEAEALDLENKLTSELSGLLREAREAYDAIRAAHGEETTMMHYGDLEARSLALKKIQERVDKLEKFIYDAASGAMKPATDMQREAEQLLKEGSEDTVQYELDVINLLLPAHPVGAQERLKKALLRPFAEEYKRKLETKLIEINTLGEKQNKAETFLREASEQRDDIEAYRLTLNALDTFPYLPEINSKVSQAKTRALNVLSQKMDDIYRKAHSLTQLKDSDGAQTLVSEALAFAATWPLEEKPQRLDELIEEGKRIQEFDSNCRAIREQVANPDQRGVALERFEQMRKDPRFVDLPEMRFFVSEMDRYRDFGDQLREAEDARSRGDWQRVHELTSKIKESRKAGELGPQVDKLLGEAELEIKTEEARWLLDNAEVRKANNILTTIIAAEKDETRRLALKKRLENEMGIIDRTIADTPPMQELYDRAVAKQAGNLSERLEALKVYRYVGGISSEQPDKDWPVYRLSLRTADARKSATSLAEVLRTNCLTQLRDEYTTSGEGHSVDDGVLRRLSPYAATLREGYLIHSDDELALVRWVEVEWGKRQARAKETISDWKSAVEIWKKLDIHFPETPEVEEGLRYARIQQALVDTERILYNEHDEMKAIQLLQEAQQGGLDTSWEILLALAEAYSRRSEFDKAFGTLAEAESYDANKTILRKKRSLIEYEQVVQTTLAIVEHKLASGSPREALLVLKDALGNPIAKDSRRLKERREKIFLDAQDALLNAARNAREAGTDNDKIKAVTALVDLRELEELSGQPKSKRRSINELNSLSPDLSGVANTLIERTRGFNYQLRSLDVSIREADLLLGRLQTFMEIMPLFANELSDVRERLDVRYREISNVLQRLRDLSVILNDANQPDLWEKALLYNSFDAIEGKMQGMYLIGLEGIPDISQFEQKLQEWKDVYGYIIGQIKRLKQLFDGDEDFDQGIVLLRRLAARPDLRSNGNPWQSIQQREYEQILGFMENQFRVVNLFGDGQDLVGRQIIEMECRKRLWQSNTWVEWQKDCMQKMQEASDAIKSVEKYELGSKDVPLLHQRRDYQRVMDKSQIALETLNNLPLDESGTPISVSSRRVKSIFDQRKDWLDKAKEWIFLSKGALSTLNHDLDGLVPTEEQYRDAVAQHDLNRLKRLVAQNKLAGTLDDISQKRLRAYEVVLQNWLQYPEEKNNWYDKFKLG